MKPRILFIEDEPFLGKVVAESLEKEGYLVDWHTDGHSGLAQFDAGKYDLCVLDVMLPGIDGFSIGKKIREKSTSVPILFLTARDGIEDLKTGYRVGGNDYLRKPFSLDELFLRLSELIGRKSVEASAQTQIGKFIFEAHKLRLTDESGNSTKLSNRECELLSLLLENRGEILDRRRALQRLWGDDNFFTARSMDVYITKLRKKFADDPAIEIINLRGFGYKLIG